MNKIFDKVANQIDIFGESIDLNLRGKKKITTKLGAFFTLVTLSLSFAYGYVRFISMINKSDI